MNKRKYKKSTVQRVVKEPEVKYLAQPSGDKQFMIFKSFKEADEYHYRQMAELSPQEHLSNAIKWIKRLYREDLKKNPELGNNFRIS